MTGICAVIVVLWAYYPCYYSFCLVPVLVISVGLLGANYHFVSDIIAGGFLGASIAVFSMALFSTQESQPVISAEMDGTAAPVIRAKSQSGLIAVKRATILLRFDWLTSLIGALLRRL